VRWKGTYREEGWKRAAANAGSVGIRYKMWERDDYATWSLPALEAGYSALLQGKGAFEELHLRLFEAFFSKGVNIGRREEVLEVAKQVEKLDLDRFLKDYGSERIRDEVLSKCDEAMRTYQVTAIPTVLFDGGRRIVGAVPLEEYLKVLNELGIGS